MKFFKNNKISKLVLLGLVLVIGGLVLSGCQKTDEENTDTENIVTEGTENATEKSSTESEVLTEDEETSEFEEVTEAETTEDDNSEEEIKTLEGTIREGMMSTLVVRAYDNQEYQFMREDEKIESGETGMQIGNPITVKYKGELDPNVNPQDVEIISMTIRDAE